MESESVKKKIYAKRLKRRICRRASGWPCCNLSTTASVRSFPAMGELLKSCPFCGSSSVGLHQGQGVGGRDNGHRWARCECGASGPWKPTTEAIAAWNRRAVPRVRLEWRECSDRKFEAGRFSVSRLLKNKWQGYLAGCFAVTTRKPTVSTGLFYATADEAKAACEQWAQKLVEELCK